MKFEPLITQELSKSIKPDVEMSEVTYVGNMY